MIHPGTDRPGEGLRAMVIGAGRRGVAHARAAVSAGARVVAVADPDLDRARRLCESVGGEPVASLEAALAWEPNLALIASPPTAHRDPTLAAVRAGCDVILEKPIALRMDDALEIGRESRAAGRRVHVCQQQRYTRAAEVVRAALAGRKTALVHVWLYRPAPDIRGNWDRDWGGGHIVEWAIHPIDFCRFVLGDEVETVYAAYTDQILSGAEGWNNWDAYSVTLRFERGAVGSVATTYAVWPGASGGFGLDLVAEGLLVRWRGGSVELVTPTETAEVPETGDATEALHRAFYRALAAGDEAGVRLTYPDAVRTLATVLACNRSHETGRPVRVRDVLEGREA